MCTVSYIPTSGGIVITSNRDEQPGRSAQEPSIYPHNGREVVFPREPKAGGTWFVLDCDKNAAVLMNGGFEKHAWNPPYRRSRGLVLLDLFTDDDPLRHWAREDFEGIEPFTVVLFWHGRLFRLVWDGEDRHLLELDAKAPHIWSSSPLYPKHDRDRRTAQFHEFLDADPDAASIREFHHRGEHDGLEGFIIDRGFLRTVSVTQVVFGDSIDITHHDLVQDKKFHLTL